MTAHYHDLVKSGEAVSSRHYTLVEGLLQPAVRTDEPAFDLYRAGFKRLLDVALVLISLPFILPLVLLFAAIVGFDSGSPIYRQHRLGLNGKIYTMWKIRTMVLNADQKLQSHLAQNPAARQEWDSTQKLKEDPRITRFGRLLRKTSFDELPQLWNVLIGDMSLVGPRPMLPEQEVMYPGSAYFSLRPGVTGYWQISDRNETTFAARAQFDTRYGEDLSLMTDLKIIAGTFKVVLSGTGY